MSVEGFTKLAEVGISVAVIAVLFWVLFFMIKSTQATTKSMHADHREERNEWRKDTKETSDKLAVTLHDLTAAVRETRNR